MFISCREFPREIAEGGAICHDNLSSYLEGARDTERSLGDRLQLVFAIGLVAQAQDDFRATSAGLSGLDSEVQTYILELIKDPVTDPAICESAIKTARHCSAITVELKPILFQYLADAAEDESVRNAALTTLSAICRPKGSAESRILVDLVKKSFIDPDTSLAAIHLAETALNHFLEEDCVMIPQVWNQISDRNLRGELVLCARENMWGDTPSREILRMGCKDKDATGCSMADGSYDFSRLR